MNNLLEQAWADLEEAHEKEERLKAQDRVLVAPRVAALTARATATILLDIAESLRLIVEGEARGR